MSVNNGVAFVAAAGRLINAHGVEGDGARGGHEVLIKRLHVGLCQAAKIRHFRHRPVRRHRQRGASIGEICLRIAGLRYRSQQPDEKPGIGTRRNRQVAVCNITGCSAPRVNHHHFHLRVIPLCLHQPLIQYRMRPGGVRSHQYDQIAALHILIAARHHIRAKRPFVAGYGGRHAQP